MDQKSIKTLEFDKVLAKLAEYAAFSASAEMARKLLPTADLTMAQERQALTAEARLLLNLNADISVGGSRDIRPLVARAAQHGMLEAEDLLNVRYTLVTARELSRTLTEDAEKMPLLAEFGAQLPPPAGYYRGDFPHDFGAR